MEKFITLLSLLTISGITIRTVIAASLNEKQEINDEILNLRVEDNSGNINRYKRSGEYDHIPDVSKQLKEFLTDHLIRINRETSGMVLKRSDVEIQLNIKIKSVDEIIPREVVSTKAELVATDSTTVKNDDNIEQKISSSEIILKTTATESSTIGNTYDISGEIEIASLPIIGTKGKIGFKFSKSSSTTSIRSEEISKKLPSQQVILEPHSRKKVVSELYASNIISKNLVSFEVDDSSTFTVKYKGFNSDLIWSLTSRERVFNLRAKTEQYVRSVDNRYPTAIYDGIIPCVEFKNNKMYVRWYPLEVKTVKTELFSHIEKL